MAARALRLGFLAALFPAAAMAAQSDWAEADAARLRLLLPPAQSERIVGGIEIELDPGWYTYWRSPGESGVPPVFDFSQSQNVANVEVQYPVPVRHDEGGGVSLIYQDEVVFPLVVTPKDATKPFTLSLEAKFGVCSDVCVPTGASAEVTPSSAPDPLSDTRIATFAPRIPQAPEPGRFEIQSVTPEDNALLIDVRMPESSYLDLLAEPPEGWYIGQPSFVARADGVSRYRLSLAGRPKDAQLSGQTFRFVAVSGGMAIEQAVSVR